MDFRELASAGPIGGESTVAFGGLDENAAAGRGGKTVQSLRRRCGVLRSRRLFAITVAFVMAGTVLANGASAQENPAGISRAFTIPSSNIVFKGMMMISPDVEIEFSAREGALTLLAPPGSKDEKLGFILMLDRDGTFGTRGEGVVVQPFQVEPHPAGGEGLYGMARVGGNRGDIISFGESLQPLRIVVSERYFEEFRDERIVTELWDAVRNDSEALNDLEEELYLTYGPCARARLEREDGMAVCSTQLKLRRSGQLQSWRPIGHASVE